MLLHRAVWDARLPAHNMPAVTCLERRDQLIPITIAEFRSAQDLALCARAFEASLGPLTDLFAPELWQRGEGRQEEISGGLVLCRQMLFSERPECDSVPGEALQMSDRGRHALAAEAVE